MMKLKGARIPPTIVFPIQLQDQRKRDSCAKGYPQDASATSLIPLSLLHKMYPYLETLAVDSPSRGEQPVPPVSPPPRDLLSTPASVVGRARHVGRGGENHAACETSA